MSNTGTWLGNLTVPYVLYQETGSAVWVGLAAAAQFAPAFLLAPLGGSLADTVDRRVLLMRTQTGLGMVAVMMWLQWASGLHSPTLLVGLLVLFGVLNGINNPAWQSLVNDLVPRKDLLSAVTLNSLQFNVARAVGPALAGVLLATMGATWAFFFNAVSFASVVTALVFVRPHPSRRLVRPGGGFRAQWAAAFRFVAGSRATVLAIVLCCLVGLFANPVFSLTVVFSETVYDSGEIGLGLLSGALGTGAVAYAAVGLARRSGPRAFARSAGVGILILGLALATMGAVPIFGVGVLAATAIGSAFLAVFATLNSAIQLLAPDPLRGKVLAIRHMVFSASTAVGVLTAGVLADVWGVGLTTVVCGVALLLALIVLVVMPVNTGLTLLNEAQPGAGRPLRGDDAEY